MMGRLLKNYFDLFYIVTLSLSKGDKPFYKGCMLRQSLS